MFSSIDRRATAERLLIGMELITGATGLAGGLLLALKPDGSLLQAQTSALQDAPFTDWRLPGLLLASLVGVGFLGTGWWQWRRLPYARELSMFAGAGLVLFEASELAWIGPQPLEAVFATVGLSVLLLAARLPGGTHTAWLRRANRWNRSHDERLEKSNVQHGTALWRVVPPRQRMPDRQSVRFLRKARREDAPHMG
jgi:hypothetical protein